METLVVGKADCAKNIQKDADNQPFTEGLELPEINLIKSFNLNETNQRITGTNVVIREPHCHECQKGKPG